MELIFTSDSVCVYDDFAHHPTAIKETIAALRGKVGDETILAVLEPRSNTMRQGVHKDLLKDALSQADAVLLYADQQVQWDIEQLADKRHFCHEDTQDLRNHAVKLIDQSKQPIHVLIMSNGGFNGLHQALVTQLTNRNIH